MECVRREPIDKDLKIAKHIGDMRCIYYLETENGEELASIKLIAPLSQLTGGNEEDKTPASPT